MESNNPFKYTYKAIYRAPVTPFTMFVGAHLAEKAVFVPVSRVLYVPGGAGFLPPTAVIYKSPRDCHILPLDIKQKKHTKENHHLTPALDLKKKTNHNTNPFKVEKKNQLCQPTRPSWNLSFLQGFRMIFFYKASNNLSVQGGPLPLINGVNKPLSVGVK